MTALTDPSVKTVSFEEYLAMSGEDSNSEWVNGEVIEMSPITYLHLKVAKLLMRAMDTYVEDNELGVVLYERFVMKLPDIPSAREPDILFIRQENMHRIHETFLEGPADIVVEVVSLESRLRDRATKFYEYEQGRVPEYWLIDPDRQVAEFYFLDSRGHYSAHGLDADGYFRSPFLPGFRLNPSWLWQEPLPRSSALQALVRDNSPL